MPNKKSQYRQFCRSNVAIPLFMQDWWLDLVCTDGDWDVCLTFDQGRAIIGVLPYYLTRQFGLKMIRRPLLTPYLGIWLGYPGNAQKLERRYAFEKKEMTLLLQQLPKVVFCAHHHPVGLTNGLPFHWLGFEQTNYYTYRIDTGISQETIYGNLKSSVRNKIEKAHKALEVIESRDLQQFYQINQKSFLRQQESIPYSFAFLQKLDQALASRNQRQILLARDRAGEVHAAIYLVWDQKTIYNLALGGDTQLRKSGAIQLLLWKSILLALEKDLTFDFEGSMIPGVESVFRDFGAKQVSYLRTEKTSHRFWKILKTFR